MDGAALITRLSDTGLFRLVGGAAEFGAAEDTAPSAPSAFVLLLGEDSGAKPPFTSGTQKITRLYGVIQVVRNVRDAAGVGASAALKDIRRPVLASLIGFEPFSGAEPLIFMRGRLLKFQSGFMWWQDDFLTTFYSSRPEAWA